MDELIDPEWPFLAVTFSRYWWRSTMQVESKVLTDAAGRWWPLVLLGVGAAAAFSVRREGLRDDGHIAGTQIGLPDRPERHRRYGVVRRPHPTAPSRRAAPETLVTVYAVQWLLPSTLVPQYDGTSIRSTYRFTASLPARRRHRRVEASVGPRRRRARQRRAGHRRDGRC
ncbi:MAG: hypothetical protein R2697_09310 [Ilumatobacteraceae bacterium]